MNFFVLRHIPTGRLMPQWRRNGSTWWDPQKDGGEVPRLFATRAAAAQSKRFWAAGALQYEHHHASMFDGDGYEYTTLSVVPGSARSADDIEILSVTVTISETTK